ALNRIAHDTEAEIKMVLDYAASLGVPAIFTDVWARGGAGGEELAQAVMSALRGGTGAFKPLYDASLPIKTKIETIVQKVYGGDGVDYSASAERNIEYLTSI